MNYGFFMSQKYHFFESMKPFMRPQTASGQKRHQEEGGAGGKYSRYGKDEELPHYYGHRQRLRDRFMRVGKEALADYELMELILFRALQKGDVKPLAKKILANFNDDFNVALTAHPSELMKIDGVGPAIVAEMKIVEAAAQRLGQARVVNKDALSSWDELMHYCKTVMAHRDIEQFRILFLDRKNFLIADEAQAKGTVDHVPVYPREVVKRGLELNASAIILLHNHPSGDPSPSQADLQVTQQIIQACDSVAIEVYDHVVIGKEEDFSFRANGLI